MSLYYETALPPEDEFLFTVSALVREVRTGLEGTYRNIALVGEISQCSISPSGHVYFTVVDEHAALSCVMFASNHRRLKFALEEGMRVVLYGTATLYERRGAFQLNVVNARPEGAGILAIAFEQLKKELAAKGYFDEERKRSIPPYPKRVGVVTSSTGAAIHDIIHVSGRRAPGIDIILYPSLVQGDEAAKQIAEMIRLANAEPMVDVLIVGRGGGSLEDLWAFNEEPVARAIFESDIPVVSAVGHETDISIADLVADVRAPTPSAAAEVVFPNIVERLTLVENAERRMLQAIEHTFFVMKERAARFNTEVLLRGIEGRIKDMFRDVDYLHEGLARGVDSLLDTQKHRFSLLLEKLELLSPLNVLQRGYAVASKNGVFLHDAESVSLGDEIAVRLERGELACSVTNITKEEEL